jgi:hypothetical protein
MEENNSQLYSLSKLLGACSAENAWKLSNLKHWKVNEEDRYFSCLARSDVDIDIPKDASDLGKWVEWLRGRKFITDDVLLEFIDISLIYI